MKESFKKNFGLIIAFILPLVLVAVVALSIYIPKLNVKTKYNFVYAVCTTDRTYSYSYDCKNYLQKRFSIVNNNLVVNEVNNSDIYPNQAAVDPNFKNVNFAARIFLHNTKTNESREISLDEAKNLRYDSLLTSPDGVTVSSSYSSSGGSFFPFGGGSTSYGYYLSKGSGKSKINLVNNNDMYYYYDNFNFVGWVLQN